MSQPQIQPKRLQNAGKVHKNHKIGPEQVHMDPFGLIFAQDGSHGLKTAQKTQKSGFSGFGTQGVLGPYGPLFAL